MLWRRIFLGCLRSCVLIGGIRLICDSVLGCAGDELVFRGLGVGVHLKMDWTGRWVSFLKIA